MARLIGLRYTGVKKNGINLILYRSYKTVKLTPLESYRFSGSDRVTSEAVKYYKGLSKPLQIEVIMDQELSVDEPEGPTEDNNEHSTDNGSVKIPPEITDQDGNTDQKTTVDKSDITTDAVASTASTQVNGVNVSELSDNELTEYLENNCDKSKLIELLKVLNPDAEFTEKSRQSTITKLIMECDHSSVVSELSKLV